MLMALSLAEKLGKRGLLGYSVHPGLIPNTGLSAGTQATDLGALITDLRTLISQE